MPGAQSTGDETREKGRHLGNEEKKTEAKLPRVTQDSLPTVASFRTWRG